METEHVMHTFAPVYDKKSRVLILGTFPSVSRERTGFTTAIRETASGK